MLSTTRAFECRVAAFPSECLAALVAAKLAANKDREIERAIRQEGLPLQVRDAG